MAMSAGLLDIVLQHAGVYDSGNVHRLLTGAMFGIGIGFYAFGFLASRPRESQEMTILNNP